MSWTLGVGTLGGGGSSALLGGGGLTVEVAVEIAFTSGYLTPAVSRTWTDVTDYVEGDRGISIQRGRQDQFSSPQPSRMTLTLDNKDGRFTPEYAAGANYPNIKQGRPIRVRVRVNGGSWVTHFLGYVNEWPVEWPGGSDAFSTVTVTALSRQARLGKGSTLKSIVEEEYLYDVPVLYFPLSEPSGSTTAGNIAPGRSAVLTVQQAYGSGGTIVFGAGTGPGTDDLTAPVFTAIDPSNTLELGTTMATPIAVVDGDTLDFEFFLNMTGNSISVFTLGGPASGGATVFISATGKAVVSGYLFGTSVGATSTASVNDGATHHISGRIARSAGTATASVMVDGGTRTTGTSAAESRAWAIATIQVGDGLVGTMSHVAVYVAATAMTDARVTAHSNAGLTGFSGESSGARIQRLARLAGIPSAEVSVETGLTTSMAHKDTTGELPISLMQTVAETEDGVVFDGRDGTWTFHARSHRYGSTSTFTLDCDAGDIETGLLPRLDDQHLTNDMTASRPNGVTVRSTNAASVTEYGTYRESLEVLTTSDNEVQSRADWEVNRFGTPRVAIPNVRAEVLTSSVALDLLSADIGTRFTLTNLPSQAPAATSDFFVEGVTEEIGPNSYYVEFNVSAAAYANVWQLDSATLSQLDQTTVLAY